MVEYENNKMRNLTRIAAPHPKNQEKMTKKQVQKMTRMKWISHLRKSVSFASSAFKRAFENTSSHGLLRSARNDGKAHRQARARSAYQIVNGK